MGKMSKKSLAFKAIFEKKYDTEAAIENFFSALLLGKMLENKFTIIKVGRPNVIWHESFSLDLFLSNYESDKHSFYSHGKMASKLLTFWLKPFVKDNVDFSESGMQGYNYINIDVSMKPEVFKVFVRGGL
jgi:hypothetical protein